MPKPPTVTVKVQHAPGATGAAGLALLADAVVLAAIPELDAALIIARETIVNYAPKQARRAVLEERAVKLRDELAALQYEIDEAAA